MICTETLGCSSHRTSSLIYTDSLKFGCERVDCCVSLLQLFRLLFIHAFDFVNFSLRSLQFLVGLVQIVRQLAQLPILSHNDLFFGDEFSLEFGLLVFDDQFSFFLLHLLLESILLRTLTFLLLIGKLAH